MFDIYQKPKIQTTLSIPNQQSVQFEKNYHPNPQKEKGEGGVIVWRTLEHSHVEKGRDWFFAIGIIAIALAAAAIILGNALFAVLVVVGTLAIFILGLRKPVHIRCEINKNGLLVEKTFYPYKTLESFWVEDGHESGKLHIKTTKPLSPYLNIPLRTEDIGKIRGFLGKRIEEEEFEQPFSFHIAEQLGL